MPRDPHRDQPILLGGTPLAEAAGALMLLHGRTGSAQERREVVEPVKVVEAVRLWRL